MDQENSQEVHCINCKFYEPRSGFCRKNPPSSIVVHENCGPRIMSAFPKIPMPQVDFCHQFQSINEKSLI